MDFAFFFIKKDELPVQLHGKQRPAQALKCLCFEKEKNYFGTIFVNNDLIFISEQAIPD